MHRTCLIIAFGLWGLLTGAAHADTFKLNNGETITGEILAASGNDAGVQVKLGEGKYERVPWGSFSQEDLRKFAQNKKLEPFVEPFIEISPEEKIKKTEVNITQPRRLERPPAQSFFGALLSSGLGWTIFLLLYAANLPTKIRQAEPTWQTAHEPAPETAVAVNPMQDVAAEHPAGLKLAQAQAEVAAPALPAATTYQRGQFTFNRRFFETKFPGFFGVIRRDADRDMVLVVKSSRGEFIGQRINRIAANDFHLQVQKGHASEEVMVPFIEIQEIQLKHKDA